VYTLEFTNIDIYIYLCTLEFRYIDIYNTCGKSFKKKNELEGIGAGSTIGVVYTLEFTCIDIYIHMQAYTDNKKDVGWDWCWQHQ